MNLQGKFISTNMLLKIYRWDYKGQLCELRIYPLWSLNCNNSFLVINYFPQIGRLYYNPNDTKACNELPEVPFTLDADGDITPFFIAERGECSFVKKVRNMENIGVAVAIIIDDSDEDIENVIMSDDGTGGGIRIPSMLIG